MKQYEYSPKQMENVFQTEYKVKEILEEINKEIEEKGFSIFEVSEQKRLEFLYHFGKSFFIRELTFFSILEAQLYIAGFFSLFAFYSEGGLQQALWTFLITFIVLLPAYISLFFQKKKEIQNIKNNETFEKTQGIKDRYIFISKEYIFFNSTFVKLENNSLEKTKQIYEKIFGYGKYYYDIDSEEEAKNIYKRLNKYNKQQKQITKLKNTLALLEKFFEYLEKLEQKITKEIIEIKNGSFDFVNTQNYIKEMQTTINDTIREQNTSLHLIGQLHFEKYIDFHQFKDYLGEKLIFSLKGLEFIIKNHITLIDYQKNSTKNLDSENIQLANARLKTYKTQLEQQVELLEQQIEKLEGKK